MGREVRERIEQLREKMAERGMDAYLIPTSDFHGSEYVSEYFKCREYMTGFTGSAGTAVITMEDACLWTDGRYFVQAAAELSGSGVELYRSGQEGVPTTLEFLKKHMPEQGVLGFDGRVVDTAEGERIAKALSGKKVRISEGEDLVGSIWDDRPALPMNPVWILEEKYAGKPAAEKIADLRGEMKKRQATVHLLTSLDDIAWLLNIRGNDIVHTPVVLSYLIVTKQELFLFIHGEALNEEVRAYLHELGVRIMPYEAVYQIASAFRYERVLLEKSKINYRLFRCLDASVKVIEAMNPTAAAKAVKNPVEQENMRRVHVQDGLVLTRFLHWMKEHAGEEGLNEWTAGEYLDKLRLEQENCLDMSFETISAWGPNAAMCHYTASETEKSSVPKKGLYLVDSGGQYYEGTTDVTRTIAVGPITQEEKRCCTLVACSMLRLLDAKFMYGCRGINLDYIARELLWRNGMDFNHGTGHGVGYLGCVHERPNSIRWRLLTSLADNAVLEEGMVTSDEPGLYLEGKFGIRTENLMLCVKDVKNEFGQFMKFENLTWVPIDLDTIDVSLMEARDRELLNAYHKGVYEKLSPYMTEEEKAWLTVETRAV